MIRFRMKDGSIVDAEKDCRCVTHEGPHWLHMDRIHRDRNRGLLDNGSCGDAGFAAEEMKRLRDKKQEMEARGIVGILDESNQ